MLHHLKRRTPSMPETRGNVPNRDVTFGAFEYAMAPPKQLIVLSNPLGVPWMTSSPRKAHWFTRCCSGSCGTHPGMPEPTPCLPAPSGHWDCSPPMEPSNAAETATHSAADEPMPDPGGRSTGITRSATPVAAGVSPGARPSSFVRMATIRKSSGTTARALIGASDATSVAAMSFASACRRGFDAENGAPVAVKGAAQHVSVHRGAYTTCTNDERATYSFPTAAPARRGGLRWSRWR